MASIERPAFARQPSANRRVALTFGQRRLWAWMRLHPDDPAYHQLSVIQLEGPWEGQAMRDALASTVARHASLRARFPLEGDAPVCVIDAHGDVQLRRYDLSSLDAQGREHAVETLAKREARRRFDLHGGPLFRASLLGMGKNEAVLVLCCHHMIVDGWSLGLLLGELCDTYAMLTEGHEPLRVGDAPTYAVEDYASESIAWAASEEGAQAMRYWVTQLDALTWSRLPHDAVVSNHATTRRRGHTLRRAWPDVRARVDTAARAGEVTRYQLILCAFLGHVAACTGNDDVAIATLLANRATRERQGLVGFLANTVILRHRFVRGEDPRIRLQRVSSTTRDMLRHGATSLYQVASDAPGTIDGAPSILFSLQNNPLPAMRAGNVRLSMKDVDTGIAKFDLSVYVAETPTGLDLWIEYDDALYTAAQIEDFTGGFRAALTELCDGLIDAPDASVPVPYRANVASPEALPGPSRTKGLVEAFYEAMASMPAKVALDDDGTCVTFADMQRHVAVAVARLAALGTSPGDRVAVCGPRNPLVLATLWACQIAGLTYIPLPPDLPPARIAQILDDARPAWRIADGAHASLPGTWDDLRAWHAGDSPIDAVLPPYRLPPAALPVYILYTSGSTGEPKGVVVTHGNLATFCTAMDATIPRGRDDTWLAVSSLSFDISVLELLWSMSRGMRVRIGTIGQLLAEEPGAASIADLPQLGIAFFGSTGQYATDEHLALVEAAAVWADRHDFRTVWTPERHFAAFGGFFSNPALMAAHLLSRTRKIRIHAGSVVAPLHPTARLAEDWAALARMSGGRAGLSLASGWNPADFVLADAPLAERHDDLSRKVGDLRALWRGDAVPMADPEGRFFDIRLPLTAQHDVPLSMTVSHHGDTFERAAEHGLDVLTHLLEQGLPELAANIERYRQAWHRRHGEGTPPGRVVLMVHTFVGHDREDAEARALPPLARYLASAGAALRSLHEPMPDRQPPDAAVLDIAARRLVDERSLVGDAATVGATLRALYRIGVDEVAALVDFGVSHNEVMASLERLGGLRVQTEGERADAPAATHLQCTPSAARLLLQRPGGLPRSLERLACWAIGGEAMDGELVRALRLRSNATVLNMYGPTEATVWASTVAIGPRRSGPITIGTGLPGYELRVLDERLTPVPAGVPGQLHIGGDAVASSYAGRPGATAAAFIPSPFGPEGARIYVTGDRVVRRQDGAITFLGRRDAQVKVNGHRIELDGLRALLLRHDDIADAHVRYLSAAADGSPDTLVAFVVPRAGRTCPAPAQLHDYLAAWCDLAAIPREFVPLSSFPMTASQKLDTRQLDHAWRQHASARTDEPDRRIDDPRFEQLRRFWREVLPGFDGQVDFHRAGGNSLLAMRLLALTNAHFGAQTSLVDLYRAPTLRGHFEALLATTDGHATLLVPVPRIGRYPVSFAQRAMLIVDTLARPGKAYHDAVALTLRGDIDTERLAASYALVMSRHRLFSTAYGFDDVDYYQAWRDEAAAPLVIAAPDGDGTLDQRIDAFRRRPFDLARGEVARAMLLTTAPDEHTICLVLHHIVSDGATLRMLLDEWLEHYRLAMQGRPVHPGDAAWQYVDFADWQRRRIDARASLLESFWDDRLARIRGPSTVPVTRSTQAMDLPVELDEACTRVVDRLIEDHRVGEFAALAFPLLRVLRTTHDEVVTLATDVRNRDRPEFDALPGMMVNQVPLPLHVPNDADIATSLGAVHEQVAACLSHADLPYERIVARWRRLTQGHEEPPFLVKLVLNEPTRHVGLDRVEIVEHALPTHQPKFGRLINLRRDGARYIGNIVYDPGLHTEEDMKRLWDGYRSVLDTLASGTNPNDAAQTHGAPASAANQASVGSRLLQARRRMPSGRPSAVTIEDDPDLPVARVHPAFPGQTLRAAVQGSTEALVSRVLARGALLLTGFADVDAASLATTVDALCGPALSYTERSTPRTEVGQRLYSATEYPADQRIDLHNENSYAAHWPGTLFFWCARPADSGGENLLADSARLLERIPADVVAAFERTGVLYRRELGPPLGMSWRYVFQCETPAEVDVAAAAAGYDIQWHSDERLTLHRRGQATVVHPVTGTRAWFNHALFFHESSLPADVRSGLATLYGDSYLPHASSFGDGTTIPADVVAALRVAYAEVERSVLLREGDVLVIDNLRVAHGRRPFTGQRHIRLMMGNTLGMTR